MLIVQVYGMISQYTISCSLVCRDHFYQFGEIRNLHVVPKQKCAFVSFSSREEAEKAVDGSFNKLIVRGA